MTLLTEPMQVDTRRVEYRLPYVPPKFLDEPSGRSTSGRLLPTGRKKAERGVVLNLWAYGSSAMWSAQRASGHGMCKMNGIPNRAPPTGRHKGHI